MGRRGIEYEQDELLTKARLLRDKGMTYREIAPHVGRSYSTVRYWLDVDARDKHNERIARQRGRKPIRKATGRDDSAHLARLAAHMERIQRGE